MKNCLHIKMHDAKCTEWFQNFIHSQVNLDSWCISKVVWLNTLFSKRSVHWFRPVLQLTRGQVCQMVLEVICKRPRSKIPYGSLAVLRPFDQIKTTRDRGQWPRDLRQLGWFSCALLLEKSVVWSTHLHPWHILRRTGQKTPCSWILSPSWHSDNMIHSCPWDCGQCTEPTVESKAKLYHNPRIMIIGYILLLCTVPTAQT